MIAIIDYGMGNIHSVQKALQLYGSRTLITNKPADVRAAEKVVFPGVGAFDDAMLALKKQGLDRAIARHVRDEKPFLGICLGLQVLFEASDEGLRQKGLGLLKGRVRKFKNKKGFKVPHMGWNGLNIKKTSCPLLKGIPAAASVYFCHSYYPRPGKAAVIAATTGYVGEFASVVWQDNVYGVQFHPEKSQGIGLKMLENFVKLC